MGELVFTVDGCEVVAFGAAAGAVLPGSFKVFPVTIKFGFLIPFSLASSLTLVPYFLAIPESVSPF